MVQKYFIDSWLTPCSLRSHRIANPTPKNGLRHFSALPTHRPYSGGHKSCAVKLEQTQRKADRAERLETDKKRKK